MNSASQQRGSKARTMVRHTRSGTKYGGGDASFPPTHTPTAAASPSAAVMRLSNLMDSKEETLAASLVQQLRFQPLRNAVRV
eukprot:381649-Pelagomonas_calceolata.AAC.1